MALTSKGNKHSASEDEIGLLHAMVTKIFQKKLQHWMKLLDAGGDVDLIIDMKQLNNVIKFIGDNGIVAADPAASGTTELSDEIAQIKKRQEERLKIVPFNEDERYG
ncbi:terminase small subunit [Pantoea phage Nufs112]|nr:terminase small subunit [Pantoea phage Nufs112]